MRKAIQIVLVFVIIGLGYILANNILKPIRFEREYKKRKEVVVERLKDIRTIQVAYKATYGHYTDSFDSLINFYKNGKLKLVRRVGSMDDSIAVAQGLVRRDTVLVPVKDTIFKGKVNFDIDKLGKVPFATDATFEMFAKMHETISNIQVPLFEARVHNDVFLEGLDLQQIVNLNDEIEKRNEVLPENDKKYPGLKVGSITVANNNAGNWE